MTKRLIDANAYAYPGDLINEPTVDAVEVSVLEKWLYEIAMNNTGNTLCESCEEIIRRLPGLRKFAEEYGGQAPQREAPCADDRG